MGGRCKGGYACHSRVISLQLPQLLIGKQANRPVSQEHEHASLGGGAVGQLLKAVSPEHALPPANGHLRAKWHVPGH